MRILRYLLPVALIVCFAGSCATEIPVVSDYPEDAAHRVIIDGVEVHYFDFNFDAEGTPILFIHGYSGCGFGAGYLADAMGGEYRIIAPDLPGAGWSENPPTEYTTGFYLDFLASFVSALGIDRFHLIGHSMGGQLAAMWAVEPEAADMIVDLVLVAPYGVEGEAGPVLEFLAGAGVLVDYGFVLHNETIIELAIRLNVFHDPDRIPVDLIAYLDVATFHTEGAIEALASVTHHIIAGPSIESLLPDIGCPTLIIWGADDRVLDFRFSADFYSLIPDVELAAIPDCGHMPHIERPDLTARALRRFYSKRTDGGA